MAFSNSMKRLPLASSNDAEDEGSPRDHLLGLHFLGLFIVAADAFQPSEVTLCLSIQQVEILIRVLFAIFLKLTMTDQLQLLRQPIATETPQLLHLNLDDSFWVIYPFHPLGNGTEDQRRPFFLSFSSQTEQS